MQLYIYPGTSVVNYVEEDTEDGVESQTKNSSKLEYDVVNNIQEDLEAAPFPLLLLFHRGGGHPQGEDRAL